MCPTGIYLTVIMAMSALSVALSVFVLNCHHRGAMLHRPPRLVRVLAATVARALCMHLRYLHHHLAASPTCRGRGPSLPSACTNNSNNHSMTNTLNNDVDSGLLHEMAHVTSADQNHVIDLGLNGLVGDPVVWTRGSNHTDSNHTNNSIEEGGGGRRGGGGGFGDPTSTTFSTATTLRLEREIANYLRAVVEAHERSKREQVAISEWQEVARVLDKFFFWVFVAVTSISTLVLLVFSPMTKDVTVPGS